MPALFSGYIVNRIAYTPRFGFLASATNYFDNKFIVAQNITAWREFLGIQSFTESWGIADNGTDKFVAVGFSGYDDDFTSKMAYSTNGTTWTAVTNRPFGANQIMDIACGKFVAVGEVG